MKALLANLFGVIGKMFAADLWLTLIALITLGVCAAGFRAHLLSPGAVPFVLAGGVVVALAVGVARGVPR